METALHEVTTIEGFKYSLYPDEFPEIGRDFDFGNEKENKEYLELFENGKCESFYVIKSKKCPTCNQWEIVDSLYGIHATGLGDALKLALESI